MWPPLYAPFGPTACHPGYPSTPLIRFSWPCLVALKVYCKELGGLEYTAMQQISYGLSVGP